ncbi:hypothetical protein KCP77_20110 [Salmonella enterica subsp. enterica]|nr:hypothetical protein KCP77_20110 [Salmonella enterica subsp. enterica]
MAQKLNWGDAISARNLPAGRLHGRGLQLLNLTINILLPAGGFLMRL